MKPPPNHNNPLGHDDGVVILSYALNVLLLPGAIAWNRN